MSLRQPKVGVFLLKKVNESEELAGVLVEGIRVKISE